MGDPAPAISASSRCSVSGSGVVWMPGAENAPSTPVVPILAASRPEAAQIWRVKLATEVLPLVPVTATTVSGCAPNHSAQAWAKAALGSSTTTSAASDPASIGGDGGADAVGQDGPRPHAQRVADEFRPVHPRAGQGREERPAHDLAAVERHAGDGHIARAGAVSPRAESGFGSIFAICPPYLRRRAPRLTTLL